MLNLLYGTKSFDNESVNEISLAYLVNMFYETGLKALKVIIFSPLHRIASNRIVLNRIESKSDRTAS